MNFCDPLHAGLAVLVALLSFMVGAALVGLILPACFALGERLARKVRE